MNENRQKLINTLEKLIEASRVQEREGKYKLDMQNWYYRYSCCIIGDLAIYKNVKFVSDWCANFVDRLRFLFEKIGLDSVISESIWAQYPKFRLEGALKFDCLSGVELTHPHLTNDHSDRGIARSYIQMIINKVRELPDE